MITLIILAIIALMVLIIGGVFVLVFGLPILDVGIAVGVLWVLFRGIPKGIKALTGLAKKKNDPDIIEGSFTETKKN